MSKNVNMRLTWIKFTVDQPFSTIGDVMNPAKPKRSTDAISHICIMILFMCLGLLFVFSSAPVHAQLQRAVVNGSFESNDPQGPGAPNFQVFTSAAVPGWEATTSEIELWDSNYQGVPAQEGAVFAELLANSAGTLYQNICLVSDEAIRWSFAHRARADGGAPTQTARFQIANNAGTVLQTLATQASTPAQAWNVNANSAGVTYSGASGIQRVQFSTPDVGSVGNFLDAIGITLAPLLEFSGGTGAGVESIANANIPALVINGNVTAAFNVTVNVTGGTATRGTDYTTPNGAATFTVTIPVGNYSNTRVSLGINVTNDMVIEANETIALSITATPASYTLSSTATCGNAAVSTATYTINDDDSGTAGTPPTLICPVGSVLFDWDTRTWTAGSLSNSYSVNGIGTVGFTLANQGAYINDAGFGGQSPALSTAVTGGISPAQNSLTQYIDFANRTQTSTASIALPVAVPGMQFRIFDIDFATGVFADRVTISGTFNGVAVTPVVTNGNSNTVAGTTATGVTTAANTTADGTVTVTFSSPVDAVVITYGNAPTAPANPDGQAMSIHDITFCNPQANLSVTKVSSIVSDGISATNPKSLPGAIVRYCILVTNAGSATATTVSASDTIPANLTFIANSMFTGTTCTGATAAEDDDATGADETNPFGMSRSGSTITGIAASLAAAASFAMVFNATVN